MAFWQWLLKSFNEKHVTHKALSLLQIRQQWCGPTAVPLEWLISFTWKKLGKHSSLRQEWTDQPTPPTTTTHPLPQPCLPSNNEVWQCNEESPHRHEKTSNCYDPRSVQLGPKVTDKRNHQQITLCGRREEGRQNRILQLLWICSRCSEFPEWI